MNLSEVSSSCSRRFSSALAAGGAADVGRPVGAATAVLETSRAGARATGRDFGAAGAALVLAAFSLEVDEPVAAPPRRSAAS